MFNDNQQAQDLTHQVSAHWGAEMTYDFFKVLTQSIDGSLFDLTSITNSPMNSKVYDNNPNWFWGPPAYGFVAGAFYVPQNNEVHFIGATDDLTQYHTNFASLDVVGHEWTHMLCHEVANMWASSSTENGALVESFCDIMGTSIEFYAEGLYDPSKNGDWTILEDSWNPNDPQPFHFDRSLSDPNNAATPNPDTYLGDEWVPSSTNPSTYVHTNCGVQNYWFYLLSEGGSGVNDNGDNYNVVGIGKDKAAQITFYSLMSYMGPNQGYLAARQNAIDATIAIFGCGEELIQCINAWDAVGVHDPAAPEILGAMQVDYSVGTPITYLTGSKIITGDITVTYNAHLQIDNANFEFYENKGIIVMPGGTLTVNNSTLTNSTCSGAYWTGIDAAQNYGIIYWSNGLKF